MNFNVVNKIVLYHRSNFNWFYPKIDNLSIDLWSRVTFLWTGELKGIYGVFLNCALLFIYLGHKNPSITSNPASLLNLNEGDSLTLICEPNTSPNYVSQLSYRWWNGTVRMTFPQTPTATLILTPLDRYKAGNYKCDTAFDYTHYKQSVGLQFTVHCKYIFYVMKVISFLLLNQTIESAWWLP